MNQNQARQIQRYICLEFSSIRKSKKIKLEDVAFALDVTPGYLSRIENAKFQNTPLYS